MCNENLTPEQRLLMEDMLRYKKLASILNPRSKAFKKYNDLYLKAKETLQRSLVVIK